MKLCKGSLLIDFFFFAEASKNMLCTFLNWVYSHQDKVICQPRQQYFYFSFLVHGIKRVMRKMSFCD